MALVNYGSSDESEVEEPKEVQESAVAPAPKESKKKPGVTKLVDQSNQGKVLINLEAINGGKAHGDDSGPAPKRAKIGSGVSGFNSALPAPKRSAAPGGKGLARGVSLRTDANPSFSREPVTTNASSPVEPSESVKAPVAQAQDQPCDTAPASEASASISIADAEPPLKPVTKFKPLSVARKPLKRRPEGAGAPDVPKAADDKGSSRPKAPGISLFSSNQAALDDLAGERDLAGPSTGSYQPILYQAESSVPPTAAGPTNLPPDQEASSLLPQSQNSSAEGQDLEAIASSLGLSASQRRQLLGRNAIKGTTAASQAVKVTNFNTDEEYAANEAMRQSGEVVKHQPVRTVAPGKHSLKQLVSSAVGQKDALEEHFAEGKRTKKEVGSRYGW